jgi:uncharacterized protein DUF4153
MHPTADTATPQTGPAPASPLAPTPTTSGAPTSLAGPRFPVHVLAVAIQIGVLGDILLRGEPPGLGFVIWVAVSVAHIAHLIHRARESVPVEARILLAVCVGITLPLLWRDADELRVMAIGTVFSATALLLASLTRRDERWAIAGTIADYLQAAWRAIGAAVGGAPSLVLRAHASAPQSRAATRWASIGGRGLIIAIPLLFVFGALLISADPVFAKLAGRVVDIDAEQVLSHALLIGVLSWFAAGWLYRSLVAPVRVPSAPRAPISIIGGAEVAMAFALLDALFLTFVLVQLRTFFGGAALVQRTAGLTFAEYARTGFFQLVWVSALALPVILVGIAAAQHGSRVARRVVYALAGVMVALLLVIMYSAVARMRLYQAMYGLTVDRFYATALMGWLAVVFCWLTVTLLRGRTRRFAPGVLVSAWAMMPVLAAMNPEAQVIRVNRARATEARPMDIAYAGRLSADAVPDFVDVLVAMPFTPSPAEGRALSDIPPQELARCHAVRGLLERWGPAATGHTGWRSWNLARSRARAAVRRHASRLTAMSCAADFDRYRRAQATAADSAAASR